jgi:hypothetical protein
MSRLKLETAPAKGVDSHFFKRRFEPIDIFGLKFRMSSLDVVEALKEAGPQTGWQLIERTRIEALPL